MENKIFWNPWHGCTKLSEGCRNCYVYRMDKRFGRNPSECKATAALDYPIKKNRLGEYKLPLNSDVMICFTSDFLLKEADEFRKIAWNCIRERKDCTFMFITKRIDRFKECMPDFWDEIKDRVTVCSTIENQEMTDYRVPILLNLPIKHRSLCVEPILEEINLEQYLKTGKIEHVTIGGESGSGARVCDYKWIRNIVDCCKQYNVDYWFKQTGARFINENGNLEKVARCNQYKRAYIYNLYTKPLANLLKED